MGVVSRGELWVLQSGDPRKERNGRTAGSGMKEKVRGRRAGTRGNSRVHNAKC